MGVRPRLAGEQYFALAFFGGEKNGENKKFFRIENFIVPFFKKLKNVTIWQKKITLGGFRLMLRSFFDTRSYKDEE